MDGPVTLPYDALKKTDQRPTVVSLFRLQAREVGTIFSVVVRIVADLVQFIFVNHDLYLNGFNAFSTHLRCPHVGLNGAGRCASIDRATLSPICLCPAACRPYIHESIDKAVMYAAVEAAMIDTVRHQQVDYDEIQCPTSIDIQCHSPEFNGLKNLVRSLC
ncbi:hypothetical protein B0H19DRAFT_1073047 [Mycena capillaripes]|nr:hypothetical protein B0H19DRAFT_1073047 [Mycena capillaripes]